MSKISQQQSKKRWRNGPTAFSAEYLQEVRARRKPAAAAAAAAARGRAAGRVAALTRGFTSARMRSCV